MQRRRRRRRCFPRKVAVLCDGTYIVFTGRGAARCDFMVVRGKMKNENERVVSANRRGVNFGGLQGRGVVQYLYGVTLRVL